MKAILPVDRKKRGSKIWPGITLQGQAMLRASTALTYLISQPMTHTTDDLQSVIYSYATGQGRAGQEHCPGGAWTVGLITDIWAGWKRNQRNEHHRYTNHLLWDKTIPLNCSRSTGLYMVCSREGKDCTCSCICDNSTKRVYTHLYIIIKCVCAYIYIRPKGWNVALLTINLASTPNVPLWHLLPDLFLPS